MHGFSAVSCWAQAGNFDRAIALGEQMLTEPGLSARLRSHIENYIQTLRRRRSAWCSELTLAAAGAEG